MPKIKVDRKQYSDELKLKILDELRSTASVKKTCDKYGVPYQTTRYWTRNKITGKHDKEILLNPLRKIDKLVSEVEKLTARAEEREAVIFDLRERQVRLLTDINRLKGEVVELRNHSPNRG